MASRLLERLRNRIRENRYVITWHATQELEDDGLGPADAAHIVLTGTIVAVQREPSSRERKYVVRGHCLAGTEACAVVKLGGTGKLVFLSTWLGSPIGHL
ncbi:MAG: hypothetical protein ACRD3J_12895 [Thermoanaerobaculia bacterium]